MHSLCKFHYLLFGLSLCTFSAGAHFLRIPAGLIALKLAISSAEPPPEVHHDGAKVVKPLEPSELAKCPSAGAKTAKSQNPDHALWQQTMLQQKSTFGPDLQLLAEATKMFPQAVSAEPRRNSFLASPRGLLTQQAAAKKANEDQAHRQRMAFACAAGCKATEPQLEESMAPWADWKNNSSGLDMIKSIEGFCNARRDSSDPFIMTVLWQGDVYLKSCKAETLKDVQLYLIGPEDLSLVLTFLFGAQKIAHLPAGPTAFGMYLSDYTSLVDHHLVGPGLPMFAYLGRKTSWAIPWPSSFSLVSTQDTEAWQLKEAAKATQKAWDKREPKAYWIGAVTGPWDFALHDGLLAVPRMKLLKTAKENPEQLQAEWSSSAGYGIAWVEGGGNVSGFNAPHSQSIEELTGIAKGKYKSVDDYANFKYYVNLDGVVLGGRINKLFSLGGVVLQHDAGYKEHTNALMKPYEHYVPVEYDLSDLVEKVQWLQRNDKEAKRIAENGKQLALQRMKFEDDACYVWRALEALGSKTASAEVAPDDVKERLKDYVKVSVQPGGFRPTMEKFWGQPLEKITTGNRMMTARGIQLLEWAWNRMEGIYQATQEQL